MPSAFVGVFTHSFPSSVFHKLSNVSFTLTSSFSLLYSLNVSLSSSAFYSILFSYYFDETLSFTQRTFLLRNFQAFETSLVSLSFHINPEETLGSLLHCHVLSSSSSCSAPTVATVSLLSVSWSLQAVF
jgi:hypothetical protein